MKRWELAVNACNFYSSVGNLIFFHVLLIFFHQLPEGKCFIPTYHWDGLQEWLLLTSTGSTCRGADPEHCSACPRVWCVSTCEAAAVAPPWICLLSPFSQPDTVATALDATKEDTLHFVTLSVCGEKVFSDVFDFTGFCWMVWFSWARNKVVLVTVCWVCL